RARREAQRRRLIRKRSLPLIGDAQAELDADEPGTVAGFPRRRWLSLRDYRVIGLQREPHANLRTAGVDAQARHHHQRVDGFVAAGVVAIGPAPGLIAGVEP